MTAKRAFIFGDPVAQSRSPILHGYRLKLYGIAGGYERIDIAPLKDGAVVHDLNYVLLETDLLKAAKANGRRILDGLGMMLRQAGYGVRRWFDLMPEVTSELRELLIADIRAKTLGAGRGERDRNRDLGIRNGACLNSNWTWFYQREEPT